MFGYIKDRIDHLQVAQADVATLPVQAVQAVRRSYRSAFKNIGIIQSGNGKFQLFLLH
jgi:hypothetical protein